MTGKGCSEAHFCPCFKLVRQGTKSNREGCPGYRLLYTILTFEVVLLFNEKEIIFVHKKKTKWLIWPISEVIQT